MPSVLVIQEHLPAFRRPFYQILRNRLAEDSIQLDLVFAPNQNNTFLKGSLDWAIPVPMRRLGPFAWQSVIRRSKAYDLIVVQQEIKYIANPVLQALAALGGPPVAYWGHGRNFQIAPGNSVGDALKGWLSTKVHWWFAYNDLSARVVRDLGFPADRITSVGNAIDTTGLIERLMAVTLDELASLHSQLGTNGSPHIAVYTGGMYPNKRIPFLLVAAHRIREKIPDFHLLMIGNGPDRHLVSAAAASYPWIHDLGPMGDQEKVPYWAISQVLLMPGLVGLVVVDSFALATPLITTDYPFHSPEIDYLRSGVNGLIVPCGESAEAYADATIDLLRNPEKLSAMREQARASAAHHTIERMAAQFAAGVRQALETPRR